MILGVPYIVPIYFIYGLAFFSMALLVAIEGGRASDVRLRRALPPLAGFGLVHGLAFATVLSNLNLGANTLALSVLGFNVGIELMQLVVVLITVPWLIVLSKKEAYKYIRTGGACFAAVAAIAWIMQRWLGKSNALSTVVESIAENARWVVFALALTAISSFFWPKSKSVA